MGRPGKGLTTSMDLSTKIPNKKKREVFPLLTLLNKISGICSRSLRIHLIYVTKVKRFIMNQLRLNYSQSKRLLNQLKAKGTLDYVPE